MIKNYIQESIDLKTRLLSNDYLLNQIETIIKNINDCFNAGGKLIIAGNGGSAADAQHFSAEIIGRYKLERRAYPAITLTANSSVITAWANDYSFDTIFSRQLEGLGKKDDLFFGISTSGNSLNIVEAVKKAKELGVKTICFLGKDGGKLKELADISIVVPSDNTPRIQEVHIMLIHIICEEIEKQLI